MLPHSDVDSIDVLAMDEQLSFRIISMRSKGKEKVFDHWNLSITETFFYNKNLN